MPSSNGIGARREIHDAVGHACDCRVQLGIISVLMVLYSNDLINEPTGVVYMENSNGPRTEPCGTPAVIVNAEERRSPIDTNCDRSARYELRH